MRVLWFTDYQPPAVRRRLGLVDDPGPQAWVQALGEQLSLEPDIALTVATRADTSLPPFEEAGVAYSVLQEPTQPSRASRMVANWRHRLPLPPLRQAAALVHQLSPDLVHVHGTEGGWGLLAPLVAPTPCVISMQGILQAYARLYFAGRSVAEVAGMVANREFLMGRGPVHGYLTLRRRAQREEKIMRAARCFIGRTEWDRAVLASVNPAAVYFHCDEIMRTPFYQAEWKHHGRGVTRLYTTSSGLMGKGTECLLDAVGILQRGGLADIGLRVAGVPPGSGLDAAYRRVARRVGVEESVDWLGRLDAAGIVDELLAADVFVYPSHVDNSPNSLVEAMVVGVPIVASFVGGVPTLLRDGEEGLLVPRGDAAVLAGAVKRLLDDRDEASQFGARARLTARRRNDPASIAARTVAIYEEVIVLARSSALAIRESTSSTSSRSLDS